MTQPSEDKRSMKYDMLGVDDQTPEEKIAKYTGEVNWKYLRPHYESGALLWVDPSLTLAQVADALSADDTETVTNWLGNGDLVKIGELHAMQWEESDELFTAVVITPFVLMQQRSEEP